MSAKGKEGVEIDDKASFETTLCQVRQRASDGTPTTSWLIVGHVDGDPYKLQVFAKNSSILGSVAGWRQRLVSDRVLYNLLNISCIEKDAVVSKFVYVRWIGENVPFIRRARFGVVQATIEQIFQPYHLHIEASSLDEVSEESIRMRLGDKNGEMNPSPVRNEGLLVPLRAPTTILIDGLGIGKNLSAAVSQVRTPNGPINWVLASFGDVNGTKALTLVAKGFSRLESLKEHLDRQQVMYIYVRIDATTLNVCPTTKLLLIQWLGDRVSPFQRGQRTLFPGAVEKAFSPHHVSVLCSGMDEFNANFIEEKVRSKVGSGWTIQW